MASIRVLHVVGQMNRGGLETWLMQVLRAVDPARVRMEFLASTGSPGHYDAEIASLGSAVIPCERPSSPVRYAWRLLDVLRERGPYDVVHSHVHHFSGFVLALAARGGVPVRIVHSHLDTRSVDAAASLPRRLYLALMTAALQRYATNGLAASGVAAEALFGTRWRDDPRWAIARCGLDFRPFREPFEVAAARAQLGVAPDALVLGHVGRFEPQKNHRFLLRIAAEVMRRDARAVLVLVGTGPLREAVEAEATSLGIRERVAFAGVRSDVPRVLRAFDVLVFPSLHEGLPLVGLEAQAAGVPIVLSDAITREVEVIPSLFTWRSLSDAPTLWADGVLAGARRRIAAPEAAARLELSEFSIARSITGLLDLYGARAAPVARSA